MTPADGGAAAWSQYANDFNNMTDDEIEYEYQSSLRLIEEEESWVEAVAAWRAAGSPRRLEEPA